MSDSRLSRRQVLLVGAAILTLPACIVRPQQTEGPYFVDEDLNRSDIRIDPSTGKLSSGMPLILRFGVSRASGKSACAPLAGARVDIWHCNAEGVYSDVVDPSFNTKGQKFLRGYQRTNSSGVATFTTIYLGWYQGRAVHIHFKVISGDREFTSQLYFPDSLTDRVQSAGYYAKPGSRTRNEEDGIFSNGGKALMLDPQRSGKGYAAIFSIGLA